MRITNVRINQLVGEGKVKALVTVVFDGVLTVTDLKVVEGSKGLFVSMPSRKNKDGAWRDIVYPCTAEMRQAIQSAVLGAYDAMAKSEVAAPEGLDGEVEMAADPAPVGQPNGVQPLGGHPPVGQPIPGQPRSPQLPAWQPPALQSGSEEPELPWESCDEGAMASQEDAGDRELVAVGGEALREG